MAKKTSKRDSAPPLRRQAEARWKASSSARRLRAADDGEAAVYELEVHQIELELQNEELRAAQLELTAARDSFQDLYDFAPLGYLTLDARRIIRQANLTAAALLGVERGKLLGMRLERFVAKESRDDFYLHLQAAQSPSASRSRTLGLRRGDGSELFVCLESRAIAGDRPEAAGYRIALIDITALHDAEEDLLKSERRYRALTEKASDYITILDAAGTISYENPSSNCTIGFAAGELVGRNAFEFAHPDDLPRAQRLFAEVLGHSDKSVEAEFRTRARDGSWRWLHVVATNLLDDPALQGIVLNARDVTDRKQAVDDLQRLNAELDQRVAERTMAIQTLQERLLTIADETQKRIAQDLHDDLGQELTGLGLQIETLEEALRARDARECKLAADVMSAVDRAREKVRRLARQFLPIEMDLGSLAGALEQLAAAASGGSRAACSFHNAHPPTAFDGRVATHLYRIAQESVSNAFHHGDARNVRIALVKVDGRTTLDVEDDGRGFPDASPSADGLGLMIMRYRAGLIGGTLEIGPRGGGGTLVRCRLAVPQIGANVPRRRQR